MPDEVRRLLQRRMDRRDLLKYTGMGVGITAVLAACKQASSAGALPSGSARPSLSAEPGDLSVYDWAGYGDGSYYPNLEKANLWQAYQEQTKQNPPFTPFPHQHTRHSKGAAPTAGGGPVGILDPGAYPL